MSIKQQADERLTGAIAIASDEDLIGLTRTRLVLRTVKQLRNLCKMLSIKGYSRMGKLELIDALLDEDEHIFGFTEMPEDEAIAPEVVEVVEAEAEPAEGLFDGVGFYVDVEVVAVEVKPAATAIAAELNRLSQYQTELLGVDVGSSLPLFAYTA